MTGRPPMRGQTTARCGAAIGGASINPMKIAIPASFELIRQRVKSSRLQLGCKSASGLDMGLLDRRTVSILFTILTFAGMVALLWWGRRPVISFIFAVFFAHLLEPVVDRFQSWLHVSRGRAVAATYLAIFGGLLIFAFTVGPRILEQGQRLSQTMPSLLEKVKSGNIAWQLGERQGWSSQTELRIQRWLLGHQEDIERYTHDITLRLGQLGANAPWILLVPVLAVFFLKDRSELRASVLKLISTSQKRAFLESVMDDLDTMLAQYVRAQLLLSFFALIAYGAFLLIARLPYAFAVAAIAGVLEFIPFAGPLLTLVILVAMAFLTGYPHWIALLLFWMIWRGIQDYVNVPRVMGEGLDLHPLLAIFAILSGGEVAGVLGIFLSIPTVAALRILWINWSRRVGVPRAA
jgi:predicted PurR-regulated permease PerM